MQIILTHENADFDAIASLLGAYKLYPNATPVLPRRLNRNVQAFLNLYSAELPFISPRGLPRGQHIDRVILVDTQTFSSVRGMARDIKEVLIIDHHEPPEHLPEGWTFRGERIGATTTLLIEALSARMIPLHKIEATLMLAGIYEDTGDLTYASTTARDMRAAAWLMDHGANLEITDEFLHHPLSPAQRDLYEHLLNTMETLTFEGHPVVIAWAESPPGLEEEISTLAHKLRDLVEPSALFILVGIDTNTQLVARSMTDDINVAEVARHFGGGGHARAAAALMRDRALFAVLNELQEVLPRFVKPSLTVRDLMSYSVRTVTPEAHVSEVAQRMIHTGHEGFPVVNKQGQVVGLITRNAVDRAIQHKWESQPVRRIMEAGEISVSPGDSAEHVRALMIQKGWGQIPVIEGKQIVGVVTRTDLIRLPPSERERERQRVARKMEQAFPKPLLALILRIGEKAAERNSHLYFVGGIVRDLLLGQPIFDVDLVVEGNAIELGRAMVQKYGGEVRVHTRFGTAKWLLTPQVWQGLFPEITESALADLPDAIDLVTARTEFYTQPTALPTVEWSSIKQDLHRRDFTINTLAIYLNPTHWGEMLDFFGGKEDLENGVIRVLHSLSFVDDPTRILRAARFETRLDFHLDPRSEALIAEALPLLDRVTGGRIRHEMELIFKEARPEAALERLQALGALQQIDPVLTCEEPVRTLFARQREELNSGFWELDEADIRHLHWLLFLSPFDKPTLKRIAVRLMMSGELRECLLALADLRALLPKLARLRKPGDIAGRLGVFTAPLLAAAWLLAGAPATREKLLRYWTEWRHIKPALTGDDLKKMGLPPGPLYKEILAALRTARLNGTITTREGEETLARELYQAAAASPEADSQEA